MAAQTLSNARGEFEFRDLPDGSYQLRAAAQIGPILFDNGAVVEVAANKALTNALLRLPAVDETPTGVGPNRRDLIL